jgi:short-chain fatty acids transporter
MNEAKPTYSDRLNNSAWLLGIIAVCGIIYIIHYFNQNGLDLNLNIMIFVFLILGLILHKSPIRYGLAMKRSCANMSGIVFQFPFYAGIMGMMIYTGLGQTLAGWMASAATVDTFPLYAYATGAFANIAIPSAGGEFAVIGPSILEAIKGLNTGNLYSLDALIARASMAIAYGETSTNAIQPFYLLIVLPVMGAGTKLQARDIMGFLIIPFLTFFTLGAVLVMLWPY